MTGIGQRSPIDGRFSAALWLGGMLSGAVALRIFHSDFAACHMTSHVIRFSENAGTEKQIIGLITDHTSRYMTCHSGFFLPA